MNERISLLLNPLVLSALLLLLINDHYIKLNFPGFLSGKISDFTGLFIFPIFLFVVFRKYFNSNRSIWVITIMTGFLFIAIKINSIFEIILKCFSKFNLPKPNIVADYTDLIALLVLPFSYLLISRNIQRSQISYRTYLFYPLIILYGLSMIASVPVSSVHTIKETALRRPRIEDFPSKSFSHIVNDVPENVKQNLLKFFSDEKLRTEDYTTTEGTYIITAYSPEPRVGRRIREAAYMIRIAYTAEVCVSKVIFTWKVHSKGNNERTWNTTFEDNRYHPTLAHEIEQKIKALQKQADINN